MISFIRLRKNINVLIKYVFLQTNALLLQRNMYQEDFGHVIDGQRESALFGSLAAKQ